MTPRQPAGALGGTKTARPRPGALRTLGAAVSLAALSAYLLLPLLVTCRTYRSLTLSQPPPCCAAGAGCRSAPTGRDLPTLSAEGTNCPFCKAASPLRHAAPSPSGGLLVAEIRLAIAAAPSLRCAPRRPPDLTSASPRAPPLAS